MMTTDLSLQVGRRSGLSCGFSKTPKFDQQRFRLEWVYAASRHIFTYLYISASEDFLIN